MKVKAEKLNEQILKDIQAKDTMHVQEAGYGDCWCNFLSDCCNGDDEYRKLYTDFLYDNFTDEGLEILWKYSHDKSCLDCEHSKIHHTPEPGLEGCHLICDIKKDVFLNGDECYTCDCYCERNPVLRAGR